MSTTNLIKGPAYSRAVVIAEPRTLYEVAAAAAFAFPWFEVGLDEDMTECIRPGVLYDLNPAVDSKKHRSREAMTVDLPPIECSSVSHEGIVELAFRFPHALVLGVHQYDAHTIVTVGDELVYLAEFINVGRYPLGYPGTDFTLCPIRHSTEDLEHMELAADSIRNAVGILGTEHCDEWLATVQNDDWCALWLKIARCETVFWLAKDRRLLDTEQVQEMSGWQESIEEDFHRNDPRPAGGI